MYWTSNTYFRFRIYIFRLIICIFVFMYDIAFLYIFCLFSFLSFYRSISTAFRTTASSQMNIGHLPKITMYWTSNTYLSIVVFIFSIMILVLITVDSIALFNKRFGTLQGIYIVNNTTLRTSTTIEMIRWSLPEFTMLWAYYTYVGFIIYIFN